MASAPLFDVASIVTPEHKDAIMREVRAYRLARVKAQLLEHKVPAILLYDPVNIRYATDTSNMQVWCGRNPSRYVMIFASGQIVAWEFHSSDHVWEGLDLDVELRSPISWTFFNAGHEAEHRARDWGAEIIDVLEKHAPGERRLAVDRLDPFGTAYLETHGLTLLDGLALMETARSIKSSVSNTSCRPKSSPGIPHPGSRLSSSSRWVLMGMTDISAPPIGCGLCFPNDFPQVLE